MLGLTAAETVALGLSLKVAIAAVICSLPFGIAVAWLLARIEFRGKIALDALVHLPLVVPPVVVGYLLLLLLGRRGPLGAFLYNTFGITVAFTWKGAAVASAVMAFPLMVRAIRLSLETMDRRFELVAETLGATAWRTFVTVTLPLILPGILTGTVLAFGRSLGEFGATITFAANIPGETRTLHLALYTLAQTPGNEWPAARMMIISLVLAIAALTASEIISRRLAKRLGVRP
jgi:molybdate transport system permease protein